MPPVGIWIDGLVQSSIYITMAFGMVLVFSILGILNWTHGQYYMLGAIMVYYGVTAVGIPFPFSMIIAGVIVAGVGILVKKLLIDRVDGHLYVGCLTLALIFVLEGASSMVFGMQPKGLTAVNAGVLGSGDLSISNQKLAVIAFTLVTMAAMYVVLYRTKVGMSIRAASQDPLAANLYGVDTGRVSLIVMGIGCGLAAFAGCIMAPIYPTDPFIGRVPMTMSLLAIVIGGIGSLRGAVVGGIILGLLDSVIAYYSSAYAEALLFILVIILLLVRPQGLFGVALK
jgi:branched-chain amino acid transport system permease protein